MKKIYDHEFTNKRKLLKAIFRISLNKDIKITPTAIADELNVNAASVVDMIKKLTEKKLILTIR